MFSSEGQCAVFIQGVLIGLQCVCQFLVEYEENIKILKGPSLSDVFFLALGLCFLFAFKQNLKMNQIHHLNMPTNVKHNLFSPIAFYILKLQNSNKSEITK